MRKTSAWPLAWVYAALPVGSAFILIAIIASMIRAVQGDWLAARDPEAAQ